MLSMKDEKAVTGDDAGRVPGGSSCLKDLSLSNPQVLIRLTILFVLTLILFYPTFPNLYHDWLTYGENSHCILVPLISIFLIWRERESIKLHEIRESKVGLLGLVCSLMIFFLGYVGGVAVVQNTALVMTIISLVLFNLGSSIFKKIVFPLLFLIFMVPIPESVISRISMPLQLGVSIIASRILEILSIPVLREGNMLHFADTSLEVAEACSGLRSLTAYLTLGCLFSYMTDGGFIKRIGMVLISIPLALIVNIVRVSGTGLIACYFGGEIARGFLHEFSGIVVFILGFMIMFAIYAGIQKNTPRGSKPVYSG